MTGITVTITSWDTASVATLIVLTLTMAVMVWQNFIAQRASESQNILAVVEFLLSEENRNAREHALKNLRNKPYKNWTKRDIWNADKVCSSYASAAALIKRKYVSKDLFVDDWGLSIKMNFEVLRVHVNARQQTSGSRYWDDFEWIYNEVLQWEEKRKYSLLYSLWIKITRG